MIETDIDDMSPLDRVKALIFERHAVAISDDDPVLEMVTIHEALIVEYKRVINDAENSQIQVLLKAAAGISDSLLQKLARMDALTATPEDARQLRKEMDDFRMDLARTRKNLLWITASIWLAGVPVFFLLLLLIIK